MADARAFLGRGWGFPVRVDAKSGAIRLSQHDQDTQPSN
jgi:hypothetical protein